MAPAISTGVVPSRFGTSAATAFQTSCLPSSCSTPQSISFLSCSKTAAAGDYCKEGQLHAKHRFMARTGRLCLSKDTCQCIPFDLRPCRPTKSDVLPEAKMLSDSQGLLRSPPPPDAVVLGSKQASNRASFRGLSDGEDAEGCFLSDDARPVSIDMETASHLRADARTAGASQSAIAAAHAHVPTSGQPASSILRVGCAIGATMAAMQLHAATRSSA